MFPTNLQTNLQHKKNLWQNISNRVRRPRLTAEDRLQVSADHCLIFFVLLEMETWDISLPPPPLHLSSVLPAEDVTCSADCGGRISALLAATSEAAGSGWDHTEPAAGNRPSRLLLSAGFSFLFLQFFFFSSRMADPTLLDTGVFLAVATHGSALSLSLWRRGGGGGGKRKDFRLISLGHE